jgi:hypothetical protein
MEACDHDKTPHLFSSQSSWRVTEHLVEMVAHMLCLWMGQGFKIQDRGGMYMLRWLGYVDGMV